MSTTAPNDTETRTLLERLLKRDDKPVQPPVADALAKLIEDYGDDEVGGLVLDAYSDEIAKAAFAKAAPPAAAAPVNLSAIESKIDALITLVQGLVADENDEEDSEDEPVAKSNEKPDTTTPLRDALLKAGVPGPMIEGLAPALASKDFAAAAAARDTLAKLAGTHDIAKLLKESGTTEGTPEQPTELSADDKAAIAAMTAGL